MDWLIIVAIIFVVVLGILKGFANDWLNNRHISKRSHQAEIVGTLKIDTSDPDGPYLFLELDKGVGDIYMKEYVQLRVDTENYLSQK